MGTSVTANKLAQAIAAMEKHIEAGKMTSEDFWAVADAYRDHIESSRRPSRWERFKTALGDMVLCNTPERARHCNECMRMG